MKTRSILFASLFVTGTAAAQTPTTPEETPVESMTTPSEEPPVESTPAERTEPGGDSAIPGAAIGIGLGWVLPTDVTIPNAASVRFRTGSGLTFEAQAILAFSSQGDETTVGGTTDEQSSSQVDLVLGLQARKPLATRGRFQFVGIGTAAVGLGTDSNEDNGDETSSSTTLAAGLGWGIGIDWFVRPGWSISLSATNPILVWEQTSTEAGTVETKSSSLLIGAVWDPSIQAMVHLYY